MNKKKLYVAGGMLNRGEVMLREHEAQLLRDCGLGEKMYNPIENKEINDKQKVDNDGLAERIFKHDVDAIRGCNLFLAEAMEKNLGTCIEIGITYGYNEMNDSIRKILEETSDDDAQKLVKLQSLIDEVVPYKEVYCHANDIRYHNEAEKGFRRSVGYHQFLLGMILKMTGRYPFGTMEEIIEEVLSKDEGQ